MKNQTKNTDCKHFETLLPLILKNHFNIKDYIFFKRHMNICENCQKKYNLMEKIFKEFKDIETKYLKHTPSLKYSINEYKNIEENISAYIDNELPIAKSLSVKKILINNTHIEKNFHHINRLITLLKSDVERYRKKINIIEKIKNFYFCLIKNK